MPYTVKQVAALSHVSIRTLHFYHEIGLLHPAHIAPNGYRFYEEPQLLTLQQILFYRELGFELRQIKQILSRPHFRKAPALRSHRKTLEKKLAHTRQLLDTLDKTLSHLKGKMKMKPNELFTGFTVPPGGDRFGEHLKLGGPAGEPIDCKLSAKDTHNALAIFEFTCHAGGPKHAHLLQDEWLYIIDGEFECHLDTQKFRLRPGQSLFIPRKIPHVWASTTPSPGKILNIYHPADSIEDFFRQIAKYDGNPPIHLALGLKGLHDFFRSHGMDLLGPPLGWNDQTPMPP
ncbi:MAG TPA: MerR family transcriptional regulator [Phycisphaerae bacterium]|nr:MerR family transcriptional regulator [Phycisphaerae bacterium]